MVYLKMKSTLPLSLDSRKAQWLEEEAKRLSISRSKLARDIIDAGVQYLSKRDSIGYAEIDFLQASDEEIIRLIRRCATVLKERKKFDNPNVISTNNNVAPKDA
jgi:hypothetical protein